MDVDASLERQRLLEVLDRLRVPSQLLQHHAETEVGGRVVGRQRDRLAQLYRDKGVLNGEEIIAYCRIGERSAHTWFVLHELLGRDDVKNYDGSWTEWGSLVGVPVEKGS